MFGVPRRRVASFEEPVKKLGDRRGRIDAFWKVQLVVEHKSRRQDLDRAFNWIAEKDLGISPLLLAHPTLRKACLQPSQKTCSMNPLQSTPENAA